MDDVLDGRKVGEVHVREEREPIEREPGMATSKTVRGHEVRQRCARRTGDGSRRGCRK